MASTKQGLLKRILKVLANASVAAIVIYVLIWMALPAGYTAPWTGFGDFTQPGGTFVRGKTLWDWLDLFIIPIFLGVGAFYLNRSERKNEREQTEDRSKVEREIAIDRQQEAALQSYLDRMTDLLLKEKLRTTESEETRDVARIRTLTVLRGLDGGRKGMVLLFLQESGLIGKVTTIKLSGANLFHANLAGADLAETNLVGTNLTMADLSGANLTMADLSGASLLAAKLNDANLTKANLSSAKLGRAYLIEANLTKANLTRADLTDADLAGANLTDANLRGTGLVGSDLTAATLRGADLSGADVSEEQLASAESLSGAIMPNGSKHRT